MTSEELLQRYAAGERDFTGITIKRINLILADLRDINLSNAKMIGTKLIGANLDGADLSGVKLMGANLTSATLCRANLVGADLDGSHLIGANFCETNLNDCNLWDAFVDGASFVGANLQRAKLMVASRLGTDFTRADLRESDLRCPRSSSIFESANLLGAVEFVPCKTDIFCKTVMPDGSIRNDGCWPDVAELS